MFEWQFICSYSKCTDQLLLSVYARRSPAHCIEYVHLILWGEQRQSEEFDTDNEEHMKWVYNKAVERGAHYGIQVCCV